MTMVELMMAVTIIMLVIVPLTRVLFKSMRGVMNFGDANKAVQLAQDLMEEIKQKKWDENEPGGGGKTPEPGYGGGMGIAPVAGCYTAIGIDGAELGPDSTGDNYAKVGGSPANQVIAWDDIDDYNGLREKPPRDVANNIVPNAQKFTRSVAVRYVAITNGGVLTPLAGLTTHYKEIAITVDWEGRIGGAPVRVTTVRSNIKRY